MNIDYTRIEYMRTLLEDDFTSELESFLHNAGSYSVGMGAALKAKNRVELSALAHKLKSISGQLGLKEVERLCEALEYGKDTPEDTLSALHGKLAAALEAVERELKARYLNTPTAT